MIYKNRAMNVRVQLIVSFLLIFGLQTASAQLVFSNPGSNGAVVASAPDYATEVLNNPWDMDSIDDLAEFIPVADYGTGLTNYTQYDFTGGELDFTINSADGAFFHVLSPGQSGTNPLGKNGQALPIDSTRYRYLLIRMNTDTPSEMRIHWNTGTDYASKYVRSTTITTTTGWKTYVIDLENIGVDSNSNETRGWSEAQRITGLRIEPGFGGNVTIDWMRLVGDAPTDFTLNYSFTPTGNNTRYSIFLDTDTDPFNGYEARIVDGASSGSSATIDPTFVYPEELNVIGFAHDDFSLLHGDPWDMGNVGDVYQTSGLADTGFSNGSFSARTTVRGAWFSLNIKEPIDTSVYRYLTVAMTVSGDGVTRVRWYADGQTADSAYLDQYNTNVGTGFQVVKIDLQSVGNWSGDIGNLRIYPKYESGANFEIHYVALQENGYSDSQPSASIVTADGTLTINDPPRLEVLQPDPKGGVDFATEVQGGPWNMDSIRDIARVYNLKEAWIYPNNELNGRRGDFFCATNKDGSDDPIQMSVYHHEREEDAVKVDADRFKNLTFDAYVAREQDVVNGSVLRVIAWNLSRDSKQLLGDDTIIQFKGSGWFELNQDMTKLRLEELVHPVGSVPDNFWSGLFERFQVDIHEFTGSTTYCIDSIELRADDESNTQFALTFAASDADSADEDVEIAWYYNTSESTSGGTKIVDGLTLADTSRVYLWDTSGLANGTYWVYAVASDGANSVTKMGHRLVVNHDRAQDEEDPTLVVRSPENGDTVYRNLPVYGYAIDNVQIALVEVLIDGVLHHSFVPNRFDSEARQAHSTKADASKAGFLEYVSLLSIGLGNHTVTVKAWDTAGNVTSQEFAVNRINAKDPAFQTIDEGEAERVAVPLNGTDTDMSLKVRINKKKRLLKAIMQNANECSEIKLIVDADESVVVNSPELATVLETPSKRKKKLVLKGKKMKGLKPKATDTKGYLTFGLLCDGRVEDYQTVRMSKIKRPSIGKLDKYLNFLTRKVK